MTNLPVSGIFRITCPYHKKGSKWAAGWHTGVDIVSTNRRVYGTCDGSVYRLGFDKSYGNFVVVRNFSDNTFHWFCHLQTIFVKQGQNVSRGTVIGIMGNTGNSTGTHLHFEIRKHTNVYNQTNDPCLYMGVSNKTGFFNSKNYEIKETNFDIGSTVYLKCAFTGAVQGNCSLVQVKDKQFWVYNSGLSKDKTKLRAIVCYEEKEKIMIEIDSLVDNNSQFWIEKSEVE